VVMSRAVSAAALVAVAMVTRSARADGEFHFTIDVSGWTDRDFAEIDLGADQPVLVTGLEWDVTLTASDGAWLSDGWFGLGSPGEPAQIYLIPGVSDNFSGTQNYAGVVKFSDVGLSNVDLPTGVVFFQFLSFGWNIVVKEQSFVTLQYDIVPSPGALVLLAGAAAIVARGRRIGR